MLVALAFFANAFSHPVFPQTRQRRSLAAERELVKRLQLQSLLQHLEGSDSDLNFAAALDEEYRKRAAERDVNFSDNIRSKDASKSQATNTERPGQDKRSSMDKRESKDAPIPWDIVNRNVPFNAPANANSLNKRGAPCRRRRSVDGDIEKRHLKTPPGQGLVPQYNLYDEICQDSQPVEVVKIKKLIVEDGIIRDNDIIEPSMLH